MLGQYFGSGGGLWCTFIVHRGGDIYVDGSSGSKSGQDGTEWRITI